ncbi:MAG: tetratricopeptide repeat protein, partial [Flavobacteriales bacterium]|nr:tetratricopeptide repeat protein [Flavobacteriales bacterium]
MRLYFSLLFILFFNLVFSQENLSKTASESFNQGDFNQALTSYLELLKQEPENSKYNYRVGVCYLNTNIDKAKAVSYLEKTIQLPEPDPNTYYLLGRAYHFAYRFQEAIKMFEQFK